MPGEQRSIELLDTGPAPQSAGTGRRSARRTPATLIAVAALLVVALLQSRAAIEKRLAPTPPPPPPPTEQLVAIAGNGLVTVSTVDGEIGHVDLANGATRLAAGPRSSVIVYDEAGQVLVVRLDTGAQTVLATDVQRFEPSATPGRFWRDDPRDRERLVETDATGQVYGSTVSGPDTGADPRLAAVALDDRRALATNSSTVLAEHCDEGRCRIEQRSLLDTDADTVWQRIGPSPKSTANLALSPDGQWITTADRVIALYRHESGGVFMVFTDARASAFSPDSDTLYVISDSGLNVVDLVGDDLSRVPLPPLPEPLTDLLVISTDHLASAG